LKEIHAEGHVMDPISEFTKLLGFQQLQAIFAGETGYTGIVKSLDLHPVSAIVWYLRARRHKRFITRSAPCKAATPRPFSPLAGPAA
jgi:hypothetical protein